MLEWSFDDMNMDCVIGVGKWLNCAYAKVEGSGFLAQASLSRLGKISSNSLRLPAQVVAQATSSSFEREHISLRRGRLA